MRTIIIALVLLLSSVTAAHARDYNAAAAAIARGYASQQEIADSSWLAGVMFGYNIGTKGILLGSCKKPHDPTKPAYIDENEITKAAAFYMTKEYMPDTGSDLFGWIARGYAQVDLCKLPRAKQ